MTTDKHLQRDLQVIAAWHQARADLPAKIAAICEEEHEICLRIRASLLSAIPSAKRKRAPAAPLAGSLITTWSTHFNALAALVPEAERAQAWATTHADQQALVESFEERRQLHEQIKRLAAEVRGPLIGDEWRVVKEAWPGSWATQGLGADGYARASVSARADELSDIAYQVRIVREPYLRSHRYLVEVLTTEEGAEIARHQIAWSGAQWEAEVWSSGANPGALGGYGPPVTQPPLHPSRRRPVEWMQRGRAAVEGVGA